MRPLPHHPGQTKQRGAALMVMLVIMIMGGAAFLVSSLSSSALKTARQEKTSDVLAQAKEALIGYSAGDDNRPGELPCPDVNNDGMSIPVVEYSGNNCVSTIGRLPWKTLGLPDLRDAVGERLWYAVSNPFHAGASNALNSDTVGTITVRNSAGNIIYNGCSVFGANCPNPGASDAAFKTGAVAIIFSPGDVLTRQGDANAQDRSNAGVNIPSNYLDIATVGGITEDNADFVEGTSDNGFIQGAIQTYNPANIILNDQLMIITHGELFRTVEQAVGRRVRNLLNASYTKLGIFPFAAPFSDPSTSTFIAVSGEDHGLLPGATAQWAAIPTYSLSGGSADVTCELRTGNNSLPDARARCNITNIIGPPNIAMSGTLNFLGLWSEYDLTSSSEVRVIVKGTSCLAPDPSSGSTVSCAAATVPGMNAAINYTVNPNHSVTVTFTGTLIDSVTRIELRDMVLDSRYDWITQNQWNYLMYYAVSPGYDPSGSNTCNPRPASPSLPTSPSCLRVNDGSNFDDDTHALIILTGSKLTGKTHPSSARTDYLEGENSTPADFIYENQARTNSYNDQAIIVAP